MDDISQRLRAVFERTAQAFEQSADLADRHADRYEGSGRDGGFERALACRARGAARNARALADGVPPPGNKRP